MNKYEEFFDFCDGMGIVWKEGRGYGAIDKNLVEVIPPGYKFLKGFQYGVTVARNRDKKCGTLDKSGKTIIPFEFNDAVEMNQNLMLVILGEKRGIYGTKGNLMFSAIYDGVFEVQNGAFILSNGDDYLVIDRDGKVILDLKNVTYDNVHMEYDKYLKAEKRSKLQVIKSVDQMLDTIEKNNGHGKKEPEL